MKTHALGGQSVQKSLYLLTKYVGLCRPRCCLRSRKLLFYAQWGVKGRSCDGCCNEKVT